MRSYAREVAFCKIYSYMFCKHSDEDVSQFDQDKLTEDDLQFISMLTQGVIADKSNLDAIVSQFSKSFKLTRIYRPDLAALELALWEMRNTDTPHPIVINEAVTLAKKYSTEKSVSYVNGILAAYVRSIQ